jgi:hypothetical protein
MLYLVRLFIVETGSVVIKHQYVFNVREASGHHNAATHTRGHKEDLWAESLICRCLSRFVLQSMTAPEPSINICITLSSMKPECALVIIIMVFD